MSGPTSNAKTLQVSWLPSEYDPHEGKRPELTLHFGLRPKGPGLQMSGPPGCRDALQKRWRAKPSIFVIGFWGTWGRPDVLFVRGGAAQSAGGLGCMADGAKMKKWLSVHGPQAGISESWSHDGMLCDILLSFGLVPNTVRSNVTRKRLRQS